MFNIPTKQIIVNSDEQVQLLTWDGDEATASTPYVDGDVTSLTDKFVLKGFFTSPLSADVLVGANAAKITKQAPINAAAQVMTVTVTASAATEGDTFRFHFESLDRTPVVYQNDFVSKIYQIPAIGGLDSTTDIAEAIEKAIKADKNAMVTVSRAGAVLTITANDSAVKVGFFSDIATTVAVTTEPALSLNQYADLKNINWSKNIEEDRNSEYFPKRAVAYNSYSFVVTSEAFIASSGGAIPDQVNASSESTFTIWVVPGTTLDTALTDLAADIAAIV